LPEPYVEENNLPLTTSDIYKDLGLRGYDYKGVFRGLKEADNKGKEYQIFIDTCIHCIQKSKHENVGYIC